MNRDPRDPRRMHHFPAPAPAPAKAGPGECRHCRQPLTSNRSCPNTAFIEKCEPEPEHAPDRDTQTQVPCPACERCSMCHGSHLVDADKRAAWREEHGHPASSVPADRFEPARRKR